MPPASQDASLGAAGLPPASTIDHPHDAATRKSSTQWLMLACIVASFALFWLAGNLLSIPRYRGFDASLFRQNGFAAVLALLVAVVLLFGVTLVVELIARRFWLFAGPLAALIGLSAWSFRGGPSYFSFLAPSAVNAGTNVFFVLAAEVLFYGLVLAALWYLIYRYFPPVQSPGEKPFSLRLNGDSIQVILTQAAFTILGVIVLVPSSDKQQAVFGLAAASAIAAGLTRHFHQGRAPSRWIWAAPILVGVVGYVINGFGASAALAVETGRLTGTFGALARPLPLDYATAGVVGALFGLAMTTHDWEVPLTTPAKTEPQPTSALIDAAPAAAVSHTEPAKPPTTPTSLGA